MLLLDLTLPTPAENLALDEALLEAAEVGIIKETLRIWESPQPAVIIGRSSRGSEEVDLAFCQSQGIPVLRRSSGGAAIVMGPGCLMYAVVLSLEERPALRMIDAAHRFVLGRLCDALAAVIEGVELCGISDWRGTAANLAATASACGGRTFYITALCYTTFPLDLVGACLRTAPRQPDYRAGREHGEFVANLPLAREQLQQAVLTAFPTQGLLTTWPRELTIQFAAEKYSQEAWNGRL